MLTEENIYVEYLKARGQYFNRGFRIPKNVLDSINKIKNKNEQNYKNLRTITLWFNTKWKDININEYFKCGFELYKSFSYHNFLDDKIIKLYIQRDKIKKHENIKNKEDIINSFKYIKNNFNKYNITKLRDYCNIKENYEYLIVKDYIVNNINIIVLLYCVLKKYLTLDDQKIKIENIIKYKNQTLELWNFLNNCESKINKLFTN